MDTIYALSSGTGKAGVSVIRISGPLSGEVVKAMCGGLPAPRRVELKSFYSRIDHRVIDRGLVVWFPAPGSFTGEDVAEFHVHGSIGVVRMMFEDFRSWQGMRPAEPGEFSRRAFLHGKLDLVEVEGLSDMIEAETPAQVRQALFHVDGEASSVFQSWRSGLVECLSLAEACIDFSDEEGVEAEARPRILSALSDLRSQMVSALAASGRGRRTRLGVRVVLVGAPNAGKSSLMNAIASRDVAIVSQQAGTTRDVVEVTLDLGGYAVDLADTAGLREGFDSEVERLGIERTKERLAEADVAVLVAAADAPWPVGFESLDSHPIRVWNKSDLAECPAGFNADLAVSARTGEGISALLDHIARKVALVSGQSEPALLVRERQISAVRRCLDALDRSLVEGTALEVLVEELRSAARLLEKLIGRVDVEDLLDEIFSRFCIGK